MTPERQRIAIAAWCGWKKGNCGWLEGPQGQETPYLPDYLNDLNAMHDAEKGLSRERNGQVSKYVGNLWRAMDGRLEAEIGTIHATAAQRAEALLRTIGKWED